MSRKKKKNSNFHIFRLVQRTQMINNKTHNSGILRIRVGYAEIGKVERVTW